MTNGYMWIKRALRKALWPNRRARVSHAVAGVVFPAPTVSVKNMSMGVNYGTEKVRCPSTVTEGSTLRATGEIISAEESGGGVKVVVRMTLAADGAERPACVVDTISLFYP